LSAHLKENPEDLQFIRGLDLFNVNKTTKKFIKRLFDKYGIGISETPYNYMKKASS